MAFSAHEPTTHAAYRTGGLAFLFAAAAILFALGSEHIGGLRPCELCLEQRYAYYVGVPLLFFGLVALSAGQARAAAVLFVLVALAFFGNAALAVYHAGVEWGFWQGPAACSGPQSLTTNAGSLLDALKTTNVVRCDQASWRMFGLSFAGWNVIASLLIAFLGLRAANEAMHAR